MCATHPIVRTRVVAVALAGVLAACASSSTPPSSTAMEVIPARAAADTAPYFEFQVERPVRPAQGFCNPRYPEDMRTAGITGEVVAHFIVDTMGTVEPETFTVVKATNAGFTSAVRLALPCMRFEPAMIKRRKVRQLVQMPFTFDIAR